jgi:long-subunit acyl-CoA synthetase (AMP-forming)
LQIWVYGNSFEATLVAVAVPNQPALEKWAQTNGVEGDFSQLCKDPKAKEFILSELGATGKMKKVSSSSSRIMAISSQVKLHGVDYFQAQVV